MQARSQVVEKVALRERLRTHKSYKVFKMIIVISPELPKARLKIICCRGGDSNTCPQHMILRRTLEKYHFLSFQYQPQISSVVLYVRWKSGVHFCTEMFPRNRCRHDRECSKKVKGSNDPILACSRVTPMRGGGGGGLAQRQQPCG